MNDLNPVRAFRRAWREVEEQFRDVPEDELPDEYKRARESAGAVDHFKDSLKMVSAERRRLKSKAQ